MHLHQATCNATFVRRHCTRRTSGQTHRKSTGDSANVQGLSALCVRVLSSDLLSGCRSWHPSPAQAARRGLTCPCSHRRCGRDLHQCSTAACSKALQQHGGHEVLPEAHEGHTPARCGAPSSRKRKAELCVCASGLTRARPHAAAKHEQRSCDKCRAHVLWCDRQLLLQLPLPPATRRYRCRMAEGDGCRSCMLWCACGMSSPGSKLSSWRSCGGPRAVICVLQ